MIIVTSVTKDGLSDKMEIILNAYNMIITNGYQDIEKDILNELLQKHYGVDLSVLKDFKKRYPEHFV